MTVHVIFPSPPQAAPIIATGQGEPSVGQDNLSKGKLTPPHWHHGDNRRAHLNLLINILNIKN